MIKPVRGTVTTDFYEMRPLSVPPEKRDHVHGAIDIAAPVGAEIYAPEAGKLFAYIAYRPQGGMSWPELPDVHGRPFPWANYFYDMYGSLLVLETKDCTHIFAHSYANQVINNYFGLKSFGKYFEEKADTRFPLHGMYSEIIDVHAGALIGYVGNAGYSTGAHVHWEIHPGNSWVKHEDRIDPGLSVA